jgi:O-antigen/teichoic acid export membrane protein
MAVHSTEKVVKNTLLYTAATVAQKAISFVYFFILSSNLAPEKLGAYTGMLAVASLASIGMDLGLTPLLTREAARDEEQAASKLRAVYSIKIPLIFVTQIALWLIAPILIDLTKTETLLLLGASLIVSIDAFTAGSYAVLRARQNIRVESKAILIFQSTVFVSGLIALLTTKNILFIMAALVLGTSTNAFYTIRSARRILGEKIAPDFDRKRIKQTLPLMPAFASAGIFTKIYQQADVVLLRALAGAHSVGLYSIPAKVTTALQTLIPGAMSAAIYPTMSNFAKTDRNRLQTLFTSTFGILYLLSLPIGIFLALLTPPILELVWPRYAAIAPAMRIMLLTIPFLFLPYSTGSLLNALGLEKRNSVNRGVMTALSVGLNLVLIPIFGVLGSAIAFILANALLLCLDIVGLRRQIRLWNSEMKRFILGSSFSALTATILGLALLNFSAAPERGIGVFSFGTLRLFAYVAFVFMACASLYAATLLLTKTLSQTDAQAVKQIFKR